MSIRQGNNIIAGSGTYHPNLFDFKWSDHILNDVQWLRADTFSWQSGLVYEAAYNHLENEILGKSLSSEVISGTTIQFYLADDGHKICPSSQEENVISIYNATGIAWYYIIDPTNHRFKLPRTKYAFTGVRNNVGKFVEAGLPDHTHDLTSRLFTCDYHSAGNNCTYEFGSSTSQKDVGVTQGVSTNSIYGNSNTVQPQATEMYLYFFVGNFTQTALENTVGITAEILNDKVDLNAENLSAAGKHVISNASMPSAIAIELTLGASGATYTAPADGYFTFRDDNRASVGDYYLYMYGTDGMTSGTSGTNLSTTTDIMAWLPCRKGSGISIYYSLPTLSSNETRIFKFIKTQGDA